MVASRSDPKTTDQELAHGIPIFLDQLIKTLRIEQTSAPLNSRLVSGESGGGHISEVGEMAALHGSDLLEQGFTIEQVVRDYGDVCQAVTNLAFETEAPIAVDEFRTLNRCLDNAIAGAVTEYARQSAASNEDSLHALNSRFGSLAHELRNHLHTATLVVIAIKAGNVGISGATGAVLDRCLLGMRNLIDRSLAEVRITAAVPHRPKPIRLAMFLSEVEVSASLDARARECQLMVTPIDRDIWVYADPEMLSSAVGNLLQNAFKFTESHTEVKLHAHICRRNIETNNGVLSVRDVPGIGCIFTIDLPRHLLS
jgi:signal transduction histidine kinase